MDHTGGAERDWTKLYRLAAGVYAMRGGQILMLERARGVMLGFWSVPGGIVDPGAPPEEAAARELCEEAGITPTGRMIQEREGQQIDHLGFGDLFTKDAIHGIGFKKNHRVRIANGAAQQGPGVTRRRRDDHLEAWVVGKVGFTAF